MTPVATARLGRLIGQAIGLVVLSGLVITAVAGLALGTGALLGLAWRGLRWGAGMP